MVHPLSCRLRPRRHARSRLTDVAAALNASASRPSARGSRSLRPNLLGGGSVSVRRCWKTLFALKSTAASRSPRSNLAYRLPPRRYKSSTGSHRPRRLDAPDVMDEGPRQESAGRRLPRQPRITGPRNSRRSRRRAPRFTHIGNLPERLKKPMQLLLLAIRAAIELSGGRSKSATPPRSRRGGGRCAVPVVLVDSGLWRHDLRTLGADRIVADGQDCRAGILELVERPRS